MMKSRRLSQNGRCRNDRANQTPPDHRLAPAAVLDRRAGVQYGVLGRHGAVATMNATEFAQRSAQLAAQSRLPYRVARAMFEAEYLVCCYLRAGQNMDKAAEIAGLSDRAVMYRLMRKRGVWPWKFRDTKEIEE